MFIKNGVTLLRFPFKNAAWIIDQLIGHGFEAYVVGGAVRDYLIDRPIHDVDIATSARPNDVVCLFKRTVPVGINHGTVAVLHHGRTYEVTTFRSESGYEDFRHPNHVSFVSSLDQDLMRRDFTINALAMDRAGKIIDLFGGQEDIRRQQIRMVGRPDERITEDPLRMMRGIRFASELEFSLGHAEQNAFLRKASLLKKISIERIDQEMVRLLAGQGVQQAIHLLYKTKCIFMLPLLDHADALNETAAIQYRILQSDEERWAAFLSGCRIMKVSTFAKHWKWSNERSRNVAKIMHWTRFRMKTDWDVASVYFAGCSIAMAVNRLLVSVGLIKEAALPDAQQEVHQLWENCPIHSRRDLAATGHDFIAWSNEKPGPWMTSVISELEKQIVNGRIENEKEAIHVWFKRWQDNRKQPY
ncbi:CCA tRNA nucleotidyltransferase [Sporolactobacillus sp. CPB3-1]|uniref:CCA-adding enzyme n=1 Tax=Sporolactobacillus mangiferae TaxID=2940498 RepID=A0ABT0MCK3_9BACL|nr:CCA tRNA nucleotidyltransferase [Sporolactobacillus mangiferae]MCL1632612.1 CCA tRNA nucleotidyltransferase [Sporolactobacillus mangiferae]